jgi:hypothetical protein
MRESFKTDFGKLVAIHVAECCKLLHDYSVSESPCHADCWHTKHFCVFPTSKNHSGVDVGI